MIHATDWFPTLLSAAAPSGDWRDVMAISASDPEPAWQQGDGIDVWVSHHYEATTNYIVLVDAAPKLHGLLAHATENAFPR